MAYRLVDAPPSLQGQDVLRADILSARILSTTGQVIHDLGPTAAFVAAVSRNSDGTSEQPVLKSADLQGFHVGMTAAEADALGMRGWKAMRGGPGSDEALYFNGLEAASPDYATCANVTFGFPDQQSYFSGAVGAPKYTDCVAISFAPGSRASGDPAARRVVGVVTQQHLPGSSPETLLAAVKAKYGPPLYTHSNGLNGSNLAWVGRDPGAMEAPPVEIEADVSVPSYAADHDVLLTVKESAYQDTRPKPAPAAAPAAAPKL